MRPAGEQAGENVPRAYAVAEAASGARIAKAPGVARVRELWGDQRVRLVVGLVAALSVLGITLHNPATPYSGNDLLYFVGRSHDLLSGRDPYAAALSGPRVVAGEYVDVYLYTPILYYILSPLSLLGFSTAWWIWSTINAVLLMGGCVALVKLMRPVASLAIGLVMAVPFALTNMAHIELYFGNVDVVLFCLLATTALAARHRKSVLAGVLLGLTPVFYLQALPIVLFYLWKREYWTVLVGALTFLVAEALGFLLAPAGTLGHFWSLTNYFFGDWSAMYINQSFYGLLARFFRPVLYSAGPLLDLPWLPAGAWLALTALVLALAARHIAPRRVAEGDSERAGLELALAIASLCLIFPILEANTFILATLPLLALTLLVAGNLDSRRSQMLGVTAVVFFIVALLPLSHLISRLSARSGLHGTGLLTVAFSATPYLYLAVALFALVYVALFALVYVAQSTPKEVAAQQSR